MDLNKVLEEREKTHGSFKNQSRVSQNLKTSVFNDNCKIKKSNQREAVEMILHKIARICAGNPNTKDHWGDIAGYAMLIVDDLDKKDNL